MKKASVICMLFAAILSGCQSSSQFQGLYMGSVLGGVFGSSIGGIMGGRRGSDAGSAVGMIIGGAAGAAAMTPKSKSEKGMNSQVDEVDEYNRHSSKKSSSSVAVNVPEELKSLEIENLRFIDANNNHCINAGERGQLVFEIHNVGNVAANNVAPVITVSGTKYILVSPTAIVSRIGPGHSVRYTAELYAKPRLRQRMADFQIGFAYGDKYVYTVRTFQLTTQE